MPILKVAEDRQSKVNLVAGQEWNLIGTAGRHRSSLVTARPNVAKEDGTVHPRYY
jgi:hypothetical protein